MTLPAGIAYPQAVFGYEADDPYADERLCFRPAPPDRLDYPDREDFYAEKEKYFRQSSIYIDCIDQWIDDARQTYMEMFQQEAQSYLDERNDVMEELRIFGQEQRGQ